MGKNIGVESVGFFEKQFKEKGVATDYGMLDCIPTLITKRQNMELT